jgi:tetraacyldisaccharide 4'-kinase
LKNIILVTGIANSKPIVNYLNDLKIKNTHLKFKDHYKYKKNDVNKILKTFEKDSKNQIILTTEKDAQKLKEFKELLNIPVYYLKVSVDFLWNKDKFEEKIMDYVKSHS